MERLDKGYSAIQEVLRALLQISRDQQRRVAQVEGSYVNLAKLVGRHEERLDEYGQRSEELRAAQANSERKIAALADAQIRAAEKFAALAESQAHNDRRMDALIDIVQNRLGNGESQT